MAYIDYYEILQVSPKAHQEIIKSAYRTMMSKMNNHPDKGGNEEMAKLINEAYEVLSDEEKRKIYDMSYIDINYTKKPEIKNDSQRKRISLSEKHTLFGHTKEVKHLAIGYYDKFLVSCQNSGIIDSFFGMFSNDKFDTKAIGWDFKTGKEIESIQWPVPEFKCIKASHSKELLGYGSDYFIMVIDMITDKEIYTLKADSGTIGGIDFNSDLTLVAYGCEGGAQVIDINTGNVVSDIVHRLPQDNIWLSGNGKILASSTNDEDLLTIWDVENQRKIRSLPFYLGSSVNLDFSGETIAISEISSVSFWNTLNGKKIGEIHLPTEVIKFGNQDLLLAQGDNNGILRIFDKNTYKELSSIQAHNFKISSICFNSDDTKVVTGSKDSTVKIWDIS